MRGLLLLLPVILVIIILAGSGQAEEEVAEQQVEGLALEEKAEVALERDAREAGKKKGANNNQEENKTKLKKRQKRLKKRKGGKKSKKAIKNKSNKEKSAKKTGEKSKKALKTKSKKQGAKRNGGKSKKKRNQNRNKPKKKNKKKLSKKQKRQKKKAGNIKKKAKGSTKKKKKGSNRNTDKKKKKKQSNNKKTPGKVKKTKRKRKGSKKQPTKSTRNGRQGPPVWSDWSSCGKSGVNDSCILNALAALNFEKNQIQTFLKQKARLLNQNKTTGNKLGKKGEFTDAAGYLLIALGGNISAPACGERESSNASKTSNTRALDVAMSTYATLMNCSAIIKEGCSMPDKHINQTFLDDCEIVYKKSKKFSEDCRGNKTYTADGSLACLCWEKAAYGIVVAKEKGCTTASTQSAKAVKKQQTACLKAFSICKKAEDAAIALVHTCMAGEINTVAAKGEGRF